MKARVVSLIVLSLPALFLMPHHHPTQPSPARLAVSLASNPFEDRPPAASRSFARSPIPRPEPTHRVPIYEVWANTPTARAVQAVETDHDPYVVSSHGNAYYFGRWQMDADFVRTYGHVDPWVYVSGGRFTMPVSMQDEIAYQGYRHRGWQPWHGDGAV